MRQSPITLLWFAAFAISACSRHRSPAPAQWHDSLFIVGTSEIGRDGGVVSSGSSRAPVRELTAGTDLGSTSHTPDPGRHLIYDQRTVTEVSATGITVEMRIVYADDYSTPNAPQKELKKTIIVPYGHSMNTSVLPTISINAHFESKP